LTRWKYGGYNIRQLFPAVILPDNLAPLPVSPRVGEAAGDIAVSFDDFVRPCDIRGVLLGSTPELPVEGLSADDFDSFAGRADIGMPPRSRWRDPSNSRLAVPDLALEPQVIHPAFEALPPVRRAAPPRARGAVDCEATFGRSKLSDRWWVIGMGLAAAAILFSGTAVDFISREAVRRSRATEAPLSRVLPPPPADHGPAAEARPAAIAVAVDPAERP
jgi:hypothetical protein